MFSFTVLTLASLAASANALVIPRHNAPASYMQGYLENYKTYNTRYMALDCESKHNTQFFDDCCHPMLAVSFPAMTNITLLQSISCIGRELEGQPQAVLHSVR